MLATTKIAIYCHYPYLALLGNIAVLAKSLHNFHTLVRHSTLIWRSILPSIAVILFHFVTLGEDNDTLYFNKKWKAGTQLRRPPSLKRLGIKCTTRADD